MAWTQSAFPASFSRCEPVSSDRDCIPGSGTATNLTNGATINVSPAGGANDVIAFNWSVKNCKQKANQLRSQLMLIVDNSKSQSTTDVQTARAPVVKSFIDAFATKAASSGVATGSADYPKIAVMNYNGRSGTELTDQRIDDLNAGFSPDYCESTNDVFPSANADSRWGSANAASKLSICEFLQFTAASDANSISNMKNFVDYAAIMPRGSTDFTYFFKGTVKAYTGVANPSNVGRNVVLVTDGLPNVPKYVAASTCRSSPRLLTEAIVSGERLGQFREYCIDRQAPTAIAQAHSEALAAPFGEVNVHHVLFTQDSTAYFDYDDSGKASLNPAGFLIENSARTGNGKVKFNYARGATELNSKLSGLFDQFDKNALQYVKVEITPAGGSKFEYKAVSPAAPESTFEIKFVGLKTGNNTVTVTPVYQDGSSSSSSTFTVFVGNSTDASLKCTAIDEGKTVDGDLIGSADPKGDGFYAAPRSGQYRDYRNSDQGNKLASEFGIVGEANSLEEYTRLRLQGGTGNCGTIAGRAVTNSWRDLLVMVLCFALPIVAVRRAARQSANRGERQQP
jgi:hypothetical protein